MTNKILSFVFVSLLLFTWNLFAQTSGSMRGTVQDNDSNPLPGAQVTISSSALIGATRTTQTNELGVFRFPSLPVGEYSVEVSLNGFETVKAEKVAVRLGATATVPLTMKMSTVTENLDIVGETPLIDPTKAGLSTNYEKEMLQELPTQHGMWDLMQVAPGMSVDYGDSQSASVIAFGSNRISNSWNIDGVDVTGPETGDAWYYVNPDVIDEIEVIGVGAPAEYGNHTGAVLNVVTKKGGNDFHGGINLFYQGDSLTGNNVTAPGSEPGTEFGFHRDQYHEFTSQLGGPILKDRLWFFGGFESQRDGFTFAGNDPRTTPISKTDKYDIKVSGRAGEQNEFSGFYHNELYGYPQSSSPNYQQSALGTETGDNPAWGGSFTSTLSNTWLMEAAYSGWTSGDRWLSVTDSLSDPFTNYEVSPETYSGGLLFPYDYITSRHQFKASMTHYADKFLGSQHEFKFGVQYGRGNAETTIAYGANGLWNYNYYGYQYRVYQAPYMYGGQGSELGLFVDDTVTVNSRLTLNLGVRFDHNKGSIPDFPRLAIGTPSISPIGNVLETGATIPGFKDLITWNLVSPRLGFTYQLAENGRSVIQGSFGVYYDHNVYGNWDAPAPGLPDIVHSVFNSDTGQYDVFRVEHSEDFTQNPNIRAPKTYQYSAGFEQQINNDSAVGVQYVYKDSRDLVGWQILGGKYGQVPYTDPFTGQSLTLLSIIEQPLLQRGNSPGDFPGSEGLKYFQKYHGVVLTYKKRFSRDWTLNASYTWSKSYGLIPQMFSQIQNSPLYSGRDGSDPNNFINAQGRLQGDRPNMFRVQGVFFHLPLDLQASVNADFSSGRPYARLAEAGGGGFLAQGRIVYTSVPRGKLRFSPIESLDLSLGRQIALTDKLKLRVEGSVYNVLNSDQELFWATQTLGPTDSFVPDTWVKPRRLQIRLGLNF